jgi:hypothetical protein
MPEIFQDVDKTSRLLHPVKDNRPLEEVFHLPTSAVAMALVAVHAVVHIAADVSMIAVGVRLGVAIRALEDSVGRRIGMTRRTYAIRIAMIHWEPRVVESRAQPTGGGVTGSTSGRESSRHVIWVVRSLVIGLVTAETVGGDCRVVVVHVTACAGYRCVSTGQRETCVVVIETCRAPRRRAVTDFALLRETRGNMVRVVRSLEIIEVAANAGCIRKVVVPVRVALTALQA